MKGHCPDCGSPMEKLRFADVFDEKGVPKPDEICEEWACRKCGTRWGGTVLKGQKVVP